MTTKDTPTSNRRVLAILPSFNEAANLRKLVPRVRAAAPNWDIAVVNDCSRDETASVASELGVILLDLPINLGIAGAVQTGILYALRENYDICMQIDGDGQHDPKESVRLLRILDKTGADVVAGSRFIKFEGFQSSRMRRWGIRILDSTILFFTGKRCTDPTSGQRIFGRSAINLLASYYPEEYPEPEVVCLIRRFGLKYVEAPVRMKEREAGESSINSYRSALYMLKVVISIWITSQRTLKRRAIES